MKRIKYLPLLFLAFDLQASQPKSGLNTKDFSDPKKGTLDWKGNPFIQQGETSGIDELTLYAVVHNQDNAQALINSQIVKKGDKIGTFTVVSIQRQSVILRNDNGVFNLSFKRQKNEKT
jgi:hypothetical protein